MLRYALADEKAQIRAKWGYCFGDSDSFLNWYFDNVYSPENTLVAEEGGQILSSLQLLPYEAGFWGGARADYVAGVATLPAARGRGLVSALLRLALSEMKERGSIISILIPFNFGFYKNYGWEICYELESISGGIGALPPYAGGELEMGGLPLAEYEAFTKGKNGHILRGEREWGEILSEGSLWGMHAATLKDGGFILYKLGKDEIDVLELGYKGIGELKTLLGFIGAHSAQAGRFKIRCDSGGLLSRLLFEKGIERSVFPHAMARVLDVSAVLALLSGGVGKAVSLSVRDFLLPQNSGNFTAKDGRVENFGKGPAMDIGTFTQLATGFISVDEAAALGLIEGDVGELHLLFKKQKNYINMLGWV